MFKTLITAAATSAALIATPVIAGNNAGQHPAQTMQIKYVDLNLGTAEGQAQLERRIDVAARKVCKIGIHRTGTRIPSSERKACFAKARQSARSQMAAVINQERRGG